MSNDDNSKGLLGGLIILGAAAYMGGSVGGWVDTATNGTEAINDDGSDQAVVAQYNQNVTDVLALAEAHSDAQALLDVAEDAPAIDDMTADTPTDEGDAETIPVNTDDADVQNLPSLSDAFTNLQNDILSADGLSEQDAQDLAERLLSNADIGALENAQTLRDIEFAYLDEAKEDGATSNAELVQETRDQYAADQNEGGGLGFLIGILMTLGAFGAASKRDANNAQAANRRRKKPSNSLD